MFNNFCTVTYILATVTPIGVKFCVMVHIGPDVVFSTFGNDTPMVVQRRRVDSTWLVAALTARSEARYWCRMAISVYPPAFNALVRESRWNIAMPFDVERLEWCGYLAVKKC